MVMRGYEENPGIALKEILNLGSVIEEMEAQTSRRTMQDEASSVEAMQDEASSVETMQDQASSVIRGYAG